jgi:hypothetical protein
MKYLSIDIETTGLDSVFNQVLSIGAIIEDTENPLPFEQCPKFHVAILRDQIVGSIYAINMNADLIETINSYQTAVDQDEKNDIVNYTGMQFMKEEDVALAFYYFLYENGMSGWESFKMAVNENCWIEKNGKKYPVIGAIKKPAVITVAGKNFGTFDKLFLERLPRWQQFIRIQQRIIDPSMYYINWKEDKNLPSLLTCKERAGIEGVVTHNAIEDAWDVIQLLRKQY